MSARATAFRSGRSARPCCGRAPVHARASRPDAQLGPYDRRKMLSAAVTGLMLAAKPSWASGQDAVLCVIDIAVDGDEYGRLVVKMFDSSTLAAQRFGDLCKGIEGVGYRRSKFDGIFEGKYLRNAGVARLAYGTTESPIAGGESLAELLREMDRSTAKHSKAGLVSLQLKPAVEIQEKTKLVAEKGKLVEVTERGGIVPNGTAFAITTGAAPDLDSTHLVVGEVVEGMDVVRKLDKLPVVKNNTNSPFFQAGKKFGDKRANVAELGFDRPFNKVTVMASGIVDG
eukprot:jgi/Ulvmu1/1789/UM119_0007.1